MSETHTRPSVNSHEPLNPKSRPPPKKILRTSYGSYEDLDGKQEYVCRWKCCLLSSCCAIILIIVTVFLIVYFAIIPSIAQVGPLHKKGGRQQNTTYTDNCEPCHPQFTPNTSIYRNPQNSSVDIEGTLELDNTGVFSATIDGGMAIVTSNGYIIGTLLMPEVSIDSDEPATIHLNTTLYVTNVTQFQVRVPSAPLPFRL